MLRYGVAVSSAALALALTALLRPLWEQAPFPLFLAAVVFSGWYGGRRPALVTTVLSAAALEFLILTPQSSGHTVAQAVRLTVFVGVALLVGSLSAARKQADAATRESERRYRDRKSVV